MLRVQSVVIAYHISPILAHSEPFLLLITFPEFSDSQCMAAPTTGFWLWQAKLRGPFKGCWADFTQGCSNLFESALSKGEVAEYTWQFKKGYYMTYVVDPIAMTQTNTKNGTTRAVRRVFIEKLPGDDEATQAPGDDEGSDSEVAASLIAEMKM